MRLGYENSENESITITLNYNNSITSKTKKEKNSFDCKIFNLNINSYYDHNENNNMTDKNELTKRYMNLIEIFKSINDMLYCIYLNMKNSILCYNISHKQIICEIKNNEKIINLKHFTDLKNKRDLFISISPKNLKLYNMNNMECLIKINEIGLLNVCFLNEKENVRILYSCCDFPYYKIKIIDLNGNILNIIHQFDDQPIFSLSIYNDIQLCESFIIAGYLGYIKSYDYNYNKYQFYQAGEGLIYSYPKYHILINHNNKITRLLVLDKYAIFNFIFVYDFHTGDVINKIGFQNKIYNFCLFNNDYIIILKDYEIEIIDINTKQAIKTIKTNKILYYIKKNDNTKQKNLSCFLCQSNFGQLVELIINNNNILTKDE